MKITVNQQSKGKPENPKASEWTSKRVNMEYDERYPELICLTPTGELAGEGTYETDGQVFWQYFHPVMQKWFKELSSIKEPYNSFEEYSAAMKEGDIETRAIYIVTTPANEQPKETLCGIDCDCKTGEDCSGDPIERLFESEESGRNWTEDFTHENGNYNNLCVQCGKNFIGHKRRIICKLCDTPAPSLAPVDESVEERATDIWPILNQYGIYRGDDISENTSISIALMLNECLKEHVRLDDVVNEKILLQARIDKLEYKLTQMIVKYEINNKPTKGN